MLPQWECGRYQKLERPHGLTDSQVAVQLNHEMECRVLLRRSFLMIDHFLAENAIFK